MQIFHRLDDWQNLRKNLNFKESLGFVPTMGNLHDGHASLYERCKKENTYTSASIFINPTQFNQRDDFTHYPRTLEADLKLLEKLGVDFCLLPNEQSIYADHYRFQVQETELTQIMEGKQRPGHFNGVLTVVLKLLNLVRPQRAYFGEKDYQQFQLISDMVSAFFLDIEIIPCPTIREESGLAFSSRNNRLSPEERRLAEQFARLFHQEPLSSVISKLEEIGVVVEYIEEHQGRRFAAVKVGEIRLIDNFAVEK